MHTKEIGGGFIHPEHKHEYEVAELRELLQRTGFENRGSARDLRDASFSRTGHFEYEDFVLGSPIVDDPEDAYIMYFAARKPAR